MLPIVLCRRFGGTIVEKRLGIQLLDVWIKVKLS